MALASNIMRGGYSAGQAKAINGAIATGLTATGTVITDAFDLVADANAFGTVAASTGAQLPNCEIGDSVWVYNGGANALKVYPDTSSSQINQLSAGTAVSLATSTVCVFMKITSTRWLACLSA